MHIFLLICNQLFAIRLHSCRCSLDVISVKNSMVIKKKKAQSFEKLTIKELKIKTSVVCKPRRTRTKQTTSFPFEEIFIYC